jgi:hypothetical protein
MSTIKIRNLPLATNEQVKPGNFLACALDTDSGLQKLTRKLTLSQVVSGGLQDGAVPIPITSLPIATTNSLGVVQIGANLNITPEGILSVNTAGIVGGLPIATTNSLGVVQIGANLNITPEGILSADNPTTPYQLPTASETVLGGIKVGDNLTIDPDGTLNAPTPSGGGGSGSGTLNWNTGWVNTDGATSVANGANLNFTHNLGSTDIVFNVYAATDSNGANAVDVSNHEISQTDFPRADYGSMVRLTNNNEINVVLASHGLLIPDVGATYNVTDSDYGGADYTHIKVVASAGGSGGGGSGSSRVSSGFQRTSCMCSPSVLTGTNGQQWVYTVSYGGTSTGYHMSIFDIDGTFLGHLFPNSAAGNSSAASWPYNHTSGWSASWPQTWIDGSMGLDSGYAIMWVKHSGSHLFSMRLNLTTGHPDSNWGQSRNSQDAGDYWAMEGIHSAGPNAFSDHWNIIGQDAGNIITTYGVESSSINYANGVQSYVMARGTYNNTYKAYNYTGSLKYMPQCSAGLNGSLNGSEHNQSYIMVAGINPTSGRVYLHRKGCDDVMTVMQLSQADGTGPSRWYRAWSSMLKTAPNQPNTGTYKLNYVGQFAIPDAINAQGGNQTTSYQVQFTTPTTANPDAVPTYLTRGGHWSNWNYGGAQVIPWQTSWEA